MKLKKKFELHEEYNQYGNYYHNRYITKKVYADDCTIGIKRITQCLDKYGKHSLILFVI